MGTINMGRVIGGGLLAGLVMNISQFVLRGVLLKAEGQAFAAKHLPGQPPNVNHLMMVLALTFVVGILAVWTYAAIRPRLGAGPKTAICAGLLVWSLTYFYSGVLIWAGYAGSILFTPALVWAPVAWTLFEVPIATLVGAWLYKE